MLKKMFFFLALLLMPLQTISAQALPAISPAPSEEAIVSFHADIKVNPDNSVDVVEMIIYETGEEARHGIYRDIYPFSSQKRKMVIEQVQVTDEAGEPYIFEVSGANKQVRIKIGDPDRTFRGQATYVIRYHATRAVGQLEAVDEIYWNVTGNEWIMPIYQAKASVVLPEGAAVVQSACYYGPSGSNTSCESDGNMFQAPGKLSPGEGFTVAVGFPKGTVAAYTAEDEVAGHFATYAPWLAAALLPLLTLVFSLLYWYRKGRDPKGRGVIIPQYDVPDNLTPMEVGGMVKARVRVEDISAEIIYFATRGYITIKEKESSFLRIKSTDYELTKRKDFSDLPNEFDRTFLNGLFAHQSKITMNSIKNIFFKGAEVPPTAPPDSRPSVALSDIKTVFYKDAAKGVKQVLAGLVEKGYYKNLGHMKNPRRFRTFVFVAIAASLFLGSLLEDFFHTGSPLPFMGGILLSLVIYGLISQFSPAKTEKGVMVKEHLLGLKEYLQIAEKDRIQFHNAPEKKPEVFEALLPYAMILGVTDIWAKEFEGLYTSPPAWYVGPSGQPFSTLALSHSLSNFRTAATSSFVGPAGTGGSGGGGSSGGGGGGGGGGGW